MYGGGYGMGGYGGMGGMSSYGGYGGMGSSLSSYGSMNRLGSTVNSANPSTDPANPNNPNQNPQENHRKHIMEEYFKMMGGLRSMVQLGFAGIALANFWSKASEIVKKIFTFLIETSKSFALWVFSKLPSNMFQKLVEAEHRPKTIKHILFNCMRFIAVCLILIGWKMTKDIKHQEIKKHEQILKKLKQQQEKQEKQKQQKMEQQDEQNLHQKQSSL